ncbi:hypothetical protein FNV43_RR25468 [Rhamnella rubrinervis]|uniref:Sucrose phosphatase-like domain-containing protein n=1 Tax=Rhamnella rubrinervis TaxID=2594499 RepID=A0A8K0GU67_9ROSA|nr:hypothetical protein FNV43_RR25468 [Rhamnella rubrinervis]
MPQSHSVIARFNREEPRGCNIVADFVAKYSIGNGLRLEVQILLSDRGGHIDQRPHKVSFSVQKVKALDIIDVLSKRLEKRGLDVKIIYMAALDVLRVGTALAYLLKKFAFDGKLPVNTLVRGDSEMTLNFSIAQVYGVMDRFLEYAVENAKEELFGSNVSPRDIKDFQKCKVDITNPGHESNQFLSVCPSRAILNLDFCIARIKEDSSYAMKRLHGDSKENIFEWADQVSSRRLARTHGGARNGSPGIGPLPIKVEFQRLYMERSQKDIIEKVLDGFVLSVLFGISFSTSLEK